MADKTVLVLGASTNPSRYSFLAINKLTAQGYKVIAIGRSGGEVAGVEIQDSLSKADESADIHTISMYLNPTHQKEYYDAIVGINPKRIIFNPGSENSALENKAAKAGIEVLEACTLVLLSTQQF